LPVYPGASGHPTYLSAEMVSAGAVGLVLKRTAATELLPAVQAVLAGRSYVSSQG